MTPVLPVPVGALQDGGKAVAGEACLIAVRRMAGRLPEEGVE